MTEITIKFKDKNRSDLRLELKENLYIDYFVGGLVRVPVATNGKVTIWKTFSADSIEEITEVVQRSKSQKVRIRND